MMEVESPKKGRRRRKRGPRKGQKKEQVIWVPKESTALVSSRAAKFRKCNRHRVEWRAVVDPPHVARKRHFPNLRESPVTSRKRWRSFDSPKEEGGLATLSSQRYRDF